MRYQSGLGPSGSFGGSLLLRTCHTGQDSKLKRPAAACLRSPYISNITNLPNPPGQVHHRLEPPPSCSRVVWCFRFSRQPPARQTGLLRRVQKQISSDRFSPSSNRGEDRPSQTKVQRLRDMTSRNAIRSQPFPSPTLDFVHAPPAVHPMSRRAG